MIYVYLNRQSSLLWLLASLYCLNAGLSGTYTVGATGYDYTNLAAVAAALNGNTLTGDVIFELRSNYVESPSSSVVFTTWIE